ncbi:MAG: ATP-binding protein [Treponemataceae bacterium]|nr:ATP-binding protein [Treponemataceae bacterium]
MSDFKEEVKNNIEKIHSFLYKEYIANLKGDYAIITPGEEEGVAVNREGVPHCFKITRLVEKLEREKDEELLSDKFKNIFAAFNNTGATIALFAVKQNKRFDFYFFVKSKEIKLSEQDRNLLKEILQANFNGTKVEIYEPDENKKNNYKSNNGFLDFNALLNEQSGSIACVSAVATEKSEKFISQGLEKLFDTPDTEDFEILILAQSLTHEDVRLAKIGYENLATEIAPFATRQEAKGKSFAESIGKSETEGKSHTHGINESISNTIGGSVGVTTGVSTSVTGGVSGGWPGGIVNVNASTSVSTSVSGSVSADYHHTKTKGFSDSDTTSSSVTSTKSTIDTLSDTTTLTYTDYLIKDSLNKIEEQVKRLDIGKSVGLWKTATYIHSSHGSAVTNKLANIYKGLIQGDKSYIEPCVVTEWTYDEKDKSYSSIVKYLKKFEHPLFVHIEDLNQSKNEFENKKNAKENQISVVTPAIFVNTSELAQQMCCPRKSVPGLPVLKCAEFAREIISFDNQDTGETLNLGKVFHMHNEENQKVVLDAKSLCSHTFITGSTGSGKSNTVYQLLSQIKEANAHFLVVEPAKGEYKDIFGNDGIAVYGTNPQISYLLRINPFSFPHGNEEPTKNIHILEHLDRLVEIFNVCWPMYAAMPAVLKEAVEKSYEDCGWNLTKSTNEYGEDLYPTFADVTRNIRTIIDSSEYDAENKGAYKGALITRLKSLSNGINGLVFTTNELSNNELFDENVIVDLSRVGSTETKSLIMGLLVLKLQEYRMTTGGGNKELKHVTVLEEAHNLLKRTSTEQSQDSGNLLGKSVEMLTNAIAEMRTYGEGFIIADQAPGLLDMAVIRNTNTKIIMRLPDLGDRELVGKAANLNDNQIEELAKLPKGVAAIYQNEWVQPVLCKVDHYNDGKTNPYTKTELKKDNEIFLSEEQKLSIVKLLVNGEALPNTFIKELSTYRLSGRSKALIMDINRKVQNKQFDKQDTVNGVVISELYSDISKTMLDINNKTSSFDELLIAYEPLLAKVIQDEELRKIVFTTLIVNLFINELHNPELLENWNNRYIVR